MTIKELKQKLEERNEKISKAQRVTTLLQKRKRLLKDRESLTDFQEPVLFLVRRDGNMQIHEKATAGKFVFEHSTGNTRFIELRPSDQITFDYADKKVRGYVAHEDRPYGGWDNPIMDSESVMLALEKTKATDLKYQTKMEELKNKNKQTWIYILIGGAIAFLIVAFAYNNWIAPSQIEKAKAIGIPTGIITIIKRKIYKQEMQ